MFDDCLRLRLAKILTKTSCLQALVSNTICRRLTLAVARLAQNFLTWARGCEVITKGICQTATSSLILQWDRGLTAQRLSTHDQIALELPVGQKQHAITAAILGPTVVLLRLAQQAIRDTIFSVEACLLLCFIGVFLFIDFSSSLNKARHQTEIDEKRNMKGNDEGDGL